jgi:glycosyltransferase involved in cell wall biosynthesis
VLSGGDWSKFRPRLVVVEANAPESWQSLLLENGYRHAAFDGINSWYVEDAESEWIELLSPPVSVLDGFVPYELVADITAPHEREPRNASPVRDAGRISSRPSVLLVLSSANQLYSGTGRVIFETFGRLIDSFKLELAIDDTHRQNVEVAEAFCSKHEVVLHLGRGEAVPSAPDIRNSELPELLETHRWDIVMGVSWANAATNQVVLAGVGDAAVAYLPLHQPSWTVPLDDAGIVMVEDVHRDMLRRADIVFCLTPWERRCLSEVAAPSVPQCAVVVPGCDFQSFSPGSAERSPDLLFVGDHREPRKRFDRVVSVFRRLREQGMQTRLVVIGNESHRATESLTPSEASSVLALGYVDQARLCCAYREAALLMLLSEYEAFGLPVIEALASATPVVMSAQPAPESVFGGNSAVMFVPGDNLGEATRVVGDVLSNGSSLRERLLADRSQLADEYDWEAVARRTRAHLMAAWARRRRASLGFIAA